MDQEYQCLRSHNTLVRLRVTHNPTTGLKYIYWGDLRVAFPGIVRVQDGDTFVPFMRCQREYRLRPFRIAYVPDAVLDVVYKDHTKAGVKVSSASRAFKKTIREQRQNHQEQHERQTLTSPTLQLATPVTKSAPSVAATASDTSLPSPSLSPSPSPSPSPAPRTPPSSDAESQEDDTSSATSSVDVEEPAAQKPSEEPASSSDLQRASKTVPQAAATALEPSSDAVTATTTAAPAAPTPAPSFNHTFTTVSTRTATVRPSTIPALAMNPHVMSNEAKLSTVMSLVKGLSLQVAGSVTHKEIHEAAAKHSVKIDDFASLLPGARKLTEAEMLATSGTYKVEGKEGVQVRDRRTKLPLQILRTYRLGSDSEDDDSKEMHTKEKHTNESGLQEKKLKDGSTQSAQTGHGRSSKVGNIELGKSYQQHHHQQTQEHLQDLKPDLDTMPLQTRKQKQTRAPSMSVPPQPSHTTDGTAKPATPAYASQYDLLTNAMPLLMQSGLFGDLTGSISGSTDAHNKTLFDVMTGTYQAGGEDMNAFQLLENHSQRALTHKGNENTIANKQVAPVTGCYNNGVGGTSSHTETSGIDDWGEAAQLLKVYTHAANKGNLWTADRVGLQLERRIFMLAGDHPEKKANVETLMKSFRAAEKKLAPTRTARMQKQVRMLLEQRQSLTESLMPTMFVILPVNMDGESPAQYRVHFLCQCRGEPLSGVSSEGDELPSHFGHFTSHPGYELVFDQQLVLMCGLYMFELLDIIRHGVTLENVELEVDEDEDEDERETPVANQVKGGSKSDTKSKAMGKVKSKPRSLNSSKTMKKTIRVPGLNPMGTPAEFLLCQRVSYAMELIMNTRCIDISSESQKAFLKGLSQELKLPSREETLGGLFRVLSSGGSARWICADHYEALRRVPRMNLFVKSITRLKGVPLFFEAHLGQVQILLPSRNELKTLFDTLRALRAPIQDMTLMLDWTLTASDMQQLHQDLLALAVNIPSIRICLGKGVVPDEIETYKQAEVKLIGSMLTRPEVHLFLLEEARPIQEASDPKTKLLINRKELHFENWERYCNTRAAVLKNAHGYTKATLLVASTTVGLEMIKRYFGEDSASLKKLVGLQLYAHEDDAAKILYKDGVVLEISINATLFSPRKLLQSPKIEELQFKVFTKQERTELEAILKRNPNICDLNVRCDMENMYDIFTLLKKWRKSHGKLPSVRIEHNQTRLWWVQELFSCEPPSLEMSAQEPHGLGRILELAMPELRTYEGPLTDAQVVTILKVVQKKGSKLTELDLDISYFSTPGFENVYALIELCRLEMLGVLVSSRPGSSLSSASSSLSLSSNPSASAHDETLTLPPMDWVQIAAFINKVRHVSRSLQFVGPNVNDILQQLQPRLDLTQLFALKKFELFGGRSVSLHSLTGLPMVLSILSKVPLWTVKLVDLDIDPNSWTQILSALNFQRLIWLDIRQCGFGPDQLGVMLNKMPKNSTLKKLYLHMSVRPTSQQLQQWRVQLAKKTLNLTFCVRWTSGHPRRLACGSKIPSIKEKHDLHERKIFSE